MNRKKNNNIATSSQYKGVCFRKRLNKWQASICINYTITYIGLFENEVEAAKAYDNKVKELHNEFGFLKFPNV